MKGGLFVDEADGGPDGIVPGVPIFIFIVDDEGGGDRGVLGE